MSHGFLSQHQISQMLNALDQFLHEVEPEVDRMGGEGDDRLSLMALMTIFNRVSIPTLNHSACTRMLAPLLSLYLCVCR